MPAEFINLMPEMQAKTVLGKDLSPHTSARQFVVEEGKTRGGVEVIVATDQQGRILGAGTSMQPNFVDFPALVLSLGQDPKAGMFVHHSHPADQEDFFSDQDMQGIARRRGIGWMLMHNEEGYSAFRISDKMFKPDADGKLPVDGLTTAYKFGKLAMLANLYFSDSTAGMDEDAKLKTAAELTLQALQQSGAIQHYTSYKTGLSHEQEQGFIRQLRIEAAAASQQQAGGAAVWSGTESAAAPAAPGRKPGSGRYPALSHTSTLETQYDRFVDIISRQDPHSLDPATAGRPQPPQVPQTSERDPGLASNRPSGRPILEGGPAKGLNR